MGSLLVSRPAGLRRVYLGRATPSGIDVPLYPGTGPIARIYRARVHGSEPVDSVYGRIYYARVTGVSP